jgi:putative ABC transport system permease protein
MNEIGKMTQVVTIIIAISTYIIMLLICAFVLKGRKREFGILLSMGEAKRKIIAQVVLEELLLMIAALCFAVLLGFATKNYVGSIMVGQTAKETNTQLERKQELSEWEGEQEGDLYKRILEHKSDLVKAKEQLAVSFLSKDMITYMGLGIILILISLTLQMQLSLTISPVKLLLSKR